ncbi:MAG: UDP-4-amino-4,6-dideoxy-N-acetyl-beta-L-altrosamine transaminase [Rhodocyclales bacterium]|nr:UDP-4-amino-4,6-dideoxy-N-acetyl-beta-L-altrosamine transaminase [Rhodocyclales bacterium]
MRNLPYARQDISQDDVDAVVRVLRSDWLTQGPVIGQFEDAVAAYCGARYASAVCNATAALHLACRALDLGAGDLLWTSPNTFVASANCALYCGASVDFVDIDPRTYNLSVDELATKLVRAEKIGRLPKIVVAVHFAGQPCDMEAIGALARRYGFAVIEDASHAIGARESMAAVGSCSHSDVTVFSFHPVKILTTGEGGMLLTNRAEIDAKVKLLRSHGITRDPSLMDEPSHGPWYYQQTELGYNYRITDIQAALGLSQLARLDAFVGRRRMLARNYDLLCGGLPIVLPYQQANVQPSWHLYVVRVPGDGRRTRNEVVANLRENGILVNVHYIPVHTQPYYRKLGFQVGDFPEAERYYDEAISLPMFFGLSEADQDRVAGQLRNILS